MKKWTIILSIGIWSCGDSGDDFDSPDQIMLLSDRAVVCPGQTATFRLFSTTIGSEIPISDFDFDPLPNGLGFISSNGIYSPPSNLSASQIEVTGTYKSKTKLSLILKTSYDSGTNQGGIESTPFDFFNLGEEYNFFYLNELRPFHFKSDGTAVVGTARIIPESLKKFEVAHYSNQGSLMWKKDFGTGKAKFIEVRDDKIYAAGNLTEMGGAIFFAVMIFDLEGNLAWENKIPNTPQHVFEGFQVDGEGNFYISSFTNGNSFITKLEKYNPYGDKVWEIDPGIGFSEIFIFPDGNIAAKSEEGWGGEPFITFFSATGQLRQKVRIQFTAVSFKGPNNTFGVGYSLQNQSNESSALYFDLFNSDGQKIMERKKISPDLPYSGKLEHPTEKKSAPAGFEKFFTDESGEVHVMHAGFWGDYGFLNLNSSSGQEWNLWKENKERTAEGALYPLQIIEEGNKLILLAQSDGKLHRYTLGKDYSFDDCLREPFWNKLDLF